MKLSGFYDFYELSSPNEPKKEIVKEKPVDTLNTVEKAVVTPQQEKLVNTPTNEIRVLTGKKKVKAKIKHN